MTALATPEQSQALTGTWTIDPAHTSIEFAVRHAMVSTVRGRFETFGGTLVLDGAAPERSRADVVIQTASITTGNEQRDNHLKSADFLELEAHPTVEFHSTRAARGSQPDGYQLWGDLTIRGVTREVELDVRLNGTAVDPYGHTRIGFEAETTINRKDWGVNWNAALEAGGVMVGDKVRINLDVEAVKQP